VFDDFIKYLDLPHGKIYVKGVSFTNTGKTDVNMNYNIDDTEADMCGNIWDK
jgi:diaminopimelate epimerase